MSVRRVEASHTHGGSRDNSQRSLTQEAPRYVRVLGGLPWRQRLVESFLSRGRVSLSPSNEQFAARAVAKFLVKCNQTSHERIVFWFTACEERVPGG